MLASLAPVSFLAILAAVACDMAIGAVWYSPLMFAKPWLKELGKSADDMKKNGSTKAIGIAFLNAIIFSVVYSQVLSFAGANTVEEALWLGFLIWLGFVTVISCTHFAFEGRSKKLWAIMIGHEFVKIAAVSAVLAVL